MNPFPLSPVESWALVIGMIAIIAGGVNLARLLETARAIRGNGAVGGGRFREEAPAPSSEEEQ